MEKLLFGAAYYEEYLPYDRLKEDIEMMKKANINVVRIAESTWSTCEPQPGIFDFSHVIRVLDAMEEANISVIVGTPTYAVPTWMVKKHPDILAVTKSGKGVYGARQIMDITNPTYLFYAKRVIEKLMEVCAHRNCVIGYQLDNETKYYDTSGENVQLGFLKYLKDKFHGDLDALNAAFGLDYWSNRINAWEDFPDVRGTINGSLGAEFSKYQRTLVTQFFAWQADIVNQYKRKDQFLTQNFDFEWRGHSYGIQPFVDVNKAAECMTIAGVDIYHPSQDALTGIEIAFGGSVARSIKKGNYLLLETQAQGFPGWLPYHGQLLQQAYSHIASGANSVMYWHWHSLHNAIETYWKGLLSHDFKENDTYLEAQKIGTEFATIGEELVDLKKENEVAMLVSTVALQSLEWFPIDSSPASAGSIKYNDIVRYVYDGLYKNNIECDFIWENDTNLKETLKQYKLICVPALYAVSEEVLNVLKEYVAEGGHIFMTFKSAFADENIKVYAQEQPHLLTDVFGITYNQFTISTRVKLKSESIIATDKTISSFMELVKADHAKVLATYDHESFSGYAALTQNQYEQGLATYLACMVSTEALEEILVETAKKAKVFVSNQRFPIIVKKGKNKKNKKLIYYFNYSKEERLILFEGEDGIELREQKQIQKKEYITLHPWDVKIIAENKKF